MKYYKVHVARYYSQTYAFTLDTMVIKYFND